MKALLALGFVIVSLLGTPGISAAQQAKALPTPSCAWQFEWTAFGLGNWLWADTANRWWYMPIDPSWKQLTITGTYPKARFFSFALYDGAPVSTGLAGRLFDAQIKPDAGSVNPFADTTATSTDHAYTVGVRRGDSGGANMLRLHARSGWLLYRLYLPDAGQGSMGGVPLPKINVTKADGETASLPPCPVVNRQSELAQLQPEIVPSALENPPAVPAVPDRIWFGSPTEPPARLLPNPDNKYLVSFFMPHYEQGRLIVIHGRMPGFPNTFEGGPISQPARHFRTVQLRYWSLCVADAVSPLPIDGCATDAATPVDRNGFYTIVITNDVLRAHWLPRNVTWLPFGDENMAPKLIFLRNTLPSRGFRKTVQNALSQGCGFDFAFPKTPGQAEIRQSGQCIQKVMGEYYPKAVWCDRNTFASGGWKACFRAAKLR